MRKKLLLAKPIREQTPDSLLAHIKALYTRYTESKESTAVPGITIHWHKRVIIKLKDKTRVFTADEVRLLALEQGKEESELLEQLLKRKIKVEGHDGKTKSTKRNANGGRKKRKKAGTDQLLQPGPIEYMPPKSSLPAESESKGE